MAVNYISATFILLIFFLKLACEDSVVAFNSFGYVTSRVESRGRAILSNVVTCPVPQGGLGLDRRQRLPTTRRQECLRLNLRASDRHDYILEANSDPNINDTCTFTEEQINVLIAKRLECKKRRNFADADRILDALNKNGIYIQDKARKYRVDGENHFGRRKHYVQRGGNYGQKDLAVIEELVEERARYKRQRDYFRSDDITDLLREKYRVRVDDRRREWSFMEQSAFEAKNNKGQETTEFYVPTPLAPRDHATHTMDDETKDYIRGQLKERSVARKSKDYKIADCILEALMEEYSVVVDDRTKEWKVILPGDSFYGDGENDSFAKEAKLSQRSAFVQTRRGKKCNDWNADAEEDSDGWYSNRDDSSMVDDELSRIIDNDDDEEEEGKEEDLGRPRSPPAAGTSDDEITIVSEKQDQLEDYSVAEEERTIEGSGEATEEDLSSLTVVALKEKLRLADLPVSGRKQELIDRILSISSNK